MSRERPKRSSLPPAQENIEKLEKVVSEGNFYGAQQMYKTVSARYIAAERYAEALDILESGACLQLQNGQITCGAELAALFVEALVKGNYACDDQTLDRVSNIYKKFPQMTIPEHLGDDDDVQQLAEALGAAKTRVECCSSFLKAALKWSSQFGPHRAGSPELHSMLAEYIYSESPEVDMAKVSFHFVRGNNPKKFASTLVNFMGKCYPSEDDLAIARGILMYLSSGNLRDANYLLDDIKQQLESKQQDFPKSDLMQFINYLLQVLQRDALPLFNMLKASYKPSIDRDPAFHEFLDLIAERFYGVQRRNPLQGMFGDIFKMMGGE
ncbi:protein GET4 isoform X1 [Rhodamnia argentea]|uniref:Protein GET4 isoform X1 n=1 Tax=Rhodamnia argentea TaxID=178133 RepID=A0A8B8QFX2_9MYRT|nr:protein GET4 isoform X1 [Rhodamnia argentea]